MMMKAMAKIETPNILENNCVFGSKFLKIDVDDSESSGKQLNITDLVGASKATYRSLESLVREIL